MWVEYGMRTDEGLYTTGVTEGTEKTHDKGKNLTVEVGINVFVG